MKCKRCRQPAEVELRHNNSAFCRPCFVFYTQRQVERAIAKEKMFAQGEPILVAVSGGKDSLALWDILIDLGYQTSGLHLSLGIGTYSDQSTAKTRQFAEARGLPLIVVSLEEEGVAVPNVARFTNRPACSACGTMKRHYFDRLAIDRGFPVVATGHNLDDEAARLLGNVLHWQMDHLARQSPVLEPTHERFVRKVKPLYRISEYESAVYAFFRGIDYIIDECPNSVGATQLLYKDALNRIEAASPGSKLTFVQEYLSRGRAGFTREPQEPPRACERCGMPSYAGVCSFCRLVGEVAKKSERRRIADQV
jgi:tRNA-5-methyluridine54 2-sulfurtransferase